jgi:hypothetical protein
MTGLDPTEAGGSALTLGFVFVLVALYREPASGLDAAMVSLQSIVYFFVLPAVGAFSGVYAATGGPYSAVLLFFFGSYLGVFGLALTVGSLLAPAPAGLSLWLGVSLLSLSVTALVASVYPLAAFVRVGVLRPPSE